MLQSPTNVSACPHVKFICFANFFPCWNKKKKIKTNLNYFVCLFQQQKSSFASEKTWENPHVPAPWVDFLKYVFFYPIKSTGNSRQTKTFYPKHFTTTWRIVKVCSRSKSCLMKKKQLLSTFINRISTLVFRSKLSKQGREIRCNRRLSKSFWWKLFRGFSW